MSTRATAPTTGEKRGFPGLPSFSGSAAASCCRSHPPRCRPAAAVRPTGHARRRRTRLGSVFSWLDPVARGHRRGGGALFANLPLIFAVGVSFGFARKSDRSTALAGLIGSRLQGRHRRHVAYPGEPEEGAPQELINFGVLGGLVMGITAALLWQRYYRIKLPPYLAFFGGRRFVPIITGLVAIIIGVLMSLLQAVRCRHHEPQWWVTENEVSVVACTARSTAYSSPSACTTS